MRTVLLLTAALLPLSLVAEEEESPAETLLQVMRYEETALAAARSMFAPFLDEMRAQGTPEAAVREVEKAANDFLGKTLLDPALRRQIIELYERRFTESELLELVEFYKTPLGRKVLDELPPIMEESARLGNEAAQKNANEFQQKVAAILEKHAGTESEEDE